MKREGGGREKQGKNRRNGGRSKKVEAKMRRTVSENIAENRGK